MDLANRSALIEYLRSVGGLDETQPAPVVTLEQFFEGNDDYGSIGCNLTDHPGPAEFYRELLAIRSRDEVHNVLVEIHEVEEGDDSMWPFSERVIVIARCELAAVADWLAPLQPSEIDAGFPLPPNAEQPPAGYTVFAAWWD